LIGIVYTNTIHSLPRTPDLKPRWYHILLSLSAGPRHGQAIARDVRRSSDGRIRLWPATLYGSLQEMADRGWIIEIEHGPSRPDDSARKRVYGLTRAGRGVFAAETSRLADLVRLARETVRRQRA
jgi:DNA-binding PadR family transcriptional regulator